MKIDLSPYVATAYVAAGQPRIVVNPLVVRVYVTKKRLKNLFDIADLYCILRE